MLGLGVPRMEGHIIINNWPHLEEILNPKRPRLGHLRGKRQSPGFKSQLHLPFTVTLPLL